MVQWVTRDVWLSTFLYFAVALVVYQLAFFPLTYYSGYMLPHRYGLSTQSLRDWLKDALKGAALSIVLGGLVISMYLPMFKLISVVAGGNG